MGKQKKLTWVNIVLYPDGKRVPFDDLDQDEQQRVGEILNRQALYAAGYREENETVTA